MNYKTMIEEARKNGRASEVAMWANVATVSELLDNIKDAHPDVYWKFMRKTHQDLYGPHYSEEFARYDICKMHSTDSNGVLHEGAHWTKQEVVSAMAGKSMPSAITDCDKWVAANAMWHDLNKVFDDKQIINAAILFYLADEDWPGTGKTWEYMMNKK